MRAMGVSAGNVAFLFVAESISLAIIFSTIGVLFAVLISSIFRIGPIFPSGGNLGLFLDGGRLVLLPVCFLRLG
jgi:ABC-type lipoprotein release transport system permease subunit